MTRNDSPDFSRQLEMNFAGIRPENAFKEHLDHAEFSVLLELRIPGPGFQTGVGGVEVFGV